MNVITVYHTPSKSAVESYYIPARNEENKYQLVSLPWGRIDYRVYNSPEDAIADLTRIVSARGCTVEIQNMSFTLTDIQEPSLVVEAYKNAVNNCLQTKDGELAVAGYEARED